MTILFVPNIKNRIQQYLCLSKQKKGYLNRDVISHIISFLSIELRKICVNQKELGNILENKYLNYHFIRDYKANEITYFKPRKLLSAKNSCSIFMRKINGGIYSIPVRKYQTWGCVKKNIEDKYDIPISKQRIIIQGMIVYNNQIVNINYINRLCCVHLVIQQ
jgi:hypothetical protein